MDARVVMGLSIAAIATLAGCSGSSGDGGGSGAQIQPKVTSGGSVDRVVATTTKSPSPTQTAPATDGCQTQNLSFSIGPAGGAAGSVYEPLRLTNKGASTCTLYGYPGVSFVTAGSGAQVGAAASRNPQHSAVTVTLAPGASAESVVQVVNHQNYAPSQCKATDVSGFRVYPPGEQAAAYVPFDHSSSACTTNVTQLTVEAVAPAS